MQISVESPSQLERRLTVSLPAERVDQEVDTRLKSLARTARIDGFRPGKVPVKVVSKLYGNQVRAKVIEELIQQSYRDAVVQEQLKPAGTPRIEPKPAQPGHGLEFVATFEVFPQLEMPALDGIEVQRPAVTIGAADVDEMLETLRRQRQSWQLMDRPVQEGDRLTLDMQVKAPDTELPEQHTHDFVLVPGTAVMIPGFEQALLGAAPGATLEFTLPFPAEYHDSRLAGRQGHFTVSLKKIEAPQLPPLDDDLALAFDVREGGLPALRREIQANMQRELDQTVKNRVKEQVLEALLQRYRFDLPTSLVDREAERLAQQAQEKAAELSPQLGFTGQLPTELFRSQAERRVRLGLIVNQLVQANGLAADPAEVRAMVETMAASYEEPDEVVRWYYGNREALAEVEALGLEQAVVDWVLERAMVVDRPMGFGELMQSARRSA